MILYHGSKDIIESPQLGKGKKYNDYGQGFYCTDQLDLAKEWAVDADRSGYANEYKINMNNLHVLELDSSKYTILNWLAILLENRHFDLNSDFGDEARKYVLEVFKPQYEQYDIIRGYRADDSYFSFAQDFLNNQISLKTLNQAMYLGKLGIQYVLKSEKAFERLRFLQSHEAFSDEWYIQKEKRDRTARLDYANLRKQPWKPGELYIMTILEERINNDDERIRQ